MKERVKTVCDSHIPLMRVPKCKLNQTSKQLVLLLGEILLNLQTNYIFFMKTVSNFAPSLLGYLLVIKA